MNISEIINQSIETTIYKHYQGLDQTNFRKRYYDHTKVALEKVFNEDNFKYFTSDNNSRNNMMAIGKDALVVELIKGAYTTYAVETIQGYARDLSTGPNGYPTTEDQAINYVYEQINRQPSPSNIYLEIQKNPYLKELLISNYATLVSSYTKEERLQGYNAYAPYNQDKLNTLDNLQNAILANPQQLQNNTNMYR